MNICVIPARGGSKRITRKNIIKFNGKPIIAYSIEAALASSCIDQVIVSTDDQEISEVAKEYGAQVPFMRPDELLMNIQQFIELPNIRFTYSWEINENKEMIFTFKNDKSFKLSIKDLKTESNEIIDGIYKLNFTKKPMPLSLSNIKQLNHPLHTIVEFMGDDSIRLGDFSPSWRVRNISFEQNKNFVLKRLKQFE